MRRPLKNPHHGYLAPAPFIVLALTVLVWNTFSAPEAFAQGKPEDCVSSGSGGNYAVVLGGDSSREAAMKQAVEYAARLAKEVRVYSHGGSYIAVLCGQLMSKEEASDEARAAESALQSTSAQVTLFERR